MVLRKAGLQQGEQVMVCLMRDQASLLQYFVMICSDSRLLLRSLCWSQWWFFVLQKNNRGKRTCFLLHLLPLQSPCERLFVPSRVCLCYCVGAVSRLWCYSSLVLRLFRAFARWCVVVYRVDIIPLLFTSASEKSAVIAQQVAADPRSVAD